MNEALAQAAPAAAPAAGGLVHTALSLLLVLAAIFALAWLLRRVQNLRPRGSGALRLHGGLQVGPRERVLWLQAGDTHLLLGVAPGRVQTLHVLGQAPEPVVAETNPQQPRAPNFAELLKKALGKRP
jgi:flagellar protein FliO/FliZ